jgi:hypothetical protein
MLPRGGTDTHEEGQTHRHMNEKIGSEATQFPEKEYIHKWDLRCSVEDMHVL